MALDKIEAVKKVGEAFNKPQGGMNPHEIADANKPQFQTMVDASKAIQPSFQPLNTAQIAPESVSPANNQQNPIFAEENVNANKNGSATDQDSKKHKKPQDLDEVTAVGTPGKKPQSSLIQEVQKLNNQVSKATKLSPDALRKQAKDMIAQIEQVKTQLTQGNVEIKPSYQTVLRNRLTHIDDNLKIALSKAGVEYTPPTPAIEAPGTQPIQKFISYLSTSQYQLEHLHQSIEQLNLTNVTLSPANMLTIQIKMGYVQQQMELFTSLLNKALESTKTIMNVQI